ncbi:MAG: hypothetical protein WCO50_02475 [Synechococcus sp. ELA619]|jgi:hypothetical protein
METRVRQPLHHLPNRKTNIIYILALTLSPIINLLVRWITFEIYWSNPANAIEGQQVMPPDHWIFTILSSGLEAVLVVMALVMVKSMLHQNRFFRKLLLSFGVLATVDLALNLIVINIGIYSFKIGSFLLLGLSSGIYISLNLVFFFWYWYDDFPTQVRRLIHPEAPCSIWFPREAIEANPRWVPSALDYLYFTVMTSNTLGPPENHSVVGNKAKILQLLQSSAMLILLVIVVSRAINTLQ